MIQAIKVIALLSSSQQPPDPRDFHGHKIYTLPARPLQTASGTIPQPPTLLSSANGYVAITKDAGILEEFLRSGDANKKPLREIPGLADAAAHVGGTGTGFFTYQNQRESMRISFKLFKNALDSDPTMKMFPKEYREWIDFSLLPDYDQVSKYFYMSVISGISSPDGITVKVFNPRPPQLN
jgi:hypothetical protein